MSANNIEDILPLSPMQQGMLFHTLYSQETGVYFEQSTWKLHGELDSAAFERAWQEVVDRHAALRTGVVWEELDEPLQVVHQQVDITIERQDWRRLPPQEQEDRLREHLQESREKGFDLTTPPLMRLELIQCSRDWFYFIWSHHHLILDGWSLPIVFQEVMTFYEAFRRGQPVYLPPAVQYREYIGWLQKQDREEAEAFWRGTLQGFTAPTSLEFVPESWRGLSESEGEFLQKSCTLPPEFTQGLLNFARQNQLTLNTLIQGAWAVLLSRYSGEEDVLFGATLSGRPPDLSGSDAIVGLLINTLPVRIKVRPGTTALEWLKEIQAAQAKLHQYEYSPLVEVQGWSEVPRDRPLFESLLVFENYPVGEALQGNQLSLEIEPSQTFSRTNYPLLLAVSPGKDFGLIVGFDASRYDYGSIGRLLGHLQTILAGIIANPDQNLEELPLLTEDEERQILLEWNATRTEFPADKCIHQLFEAHAERTPEATALVFETRSLNYAELNRQSNQLAHYLRSLGVGPEVMVGVLTDRSIEMIVAVLGVLKAGGAYVPLDPEYPLDRLAFMIEDTGIDLLLTQSFLMDRLPASQTRVICLDTDWEIISLESGENPDNKTSAENLAYVIYTSGSTGKPKGTLLQHRGFINFILAFSKELDITPDSRVLQLSSFSFDASSCEIFVTLLSGAALYLARRETIVSMPDLANLIRRDEISTIIMPPSILKLLPETDYPALKTVVSAGEACTPEIVARWAAGRRLLNGYGPTEASVGCACCHIESLSHRAIHVPVGRPLMNTQLFILDKYLQPLPVGVQGELHIGGMGLAREYLNRPEMTAEKFISNPLAGTMRAGANAFAIDVPDRLYKTGDLARFLPDGTIEVLGRIDHQVKIRGFRIELAEIESVLESHPGVQQAAVLVREDEPGEKWLVAYITSQKGELDAAKLRDYLQQQLPAYMLPSTFVLLDEMPLTPSGKINRKALPAAERKDLLTTTAYRAPHSPIEEMLVDIWARVLRVERVGIEDNFFDLGGHSLSAAQVISRLRGMFQVDIPLRDLFEAPTVARLAKRVESALASSMGLQAPPIEPVKREGNLPLSFAQQRLWFLDQLDPGNLFYNIPTAVRLEGDLDIPALEFSLNTILQRHETLRTVFAAHDGKPIQVIQDQAAISIPVVDIRDQPEEVIISLAQEEARQPFNLSTGPLLRVRLLKLGDRDHILLLTMHHIVSDGWSIGLFIQEIAHLYTAFHSGITPSLPDLEIQYVDYAQWQREWLQGEVIEKQLDYWVGQLQGSSPMLDLPTDHPRPAVQTANGAIYSFRLPENFSSSLRVLGSEGDATLFMILLAAFQTLLYRYTGQEDISVGTPIANRNRAEIEGLIGFFVNTLVMRTDLSGNPSFMELLARVRQVALDAYAHQDLPFEMLVEKLQPERDLSHTPLFQVMFVLDTVTHEPVNLPGLMLSSVDTSRGASTFDLTLSITNTEEGLGGYIEYNTDLFEQPTIERMVQHFQYLLEGILADPDQPVGELPLLGADERRQILVEWNQTTLLTPRDRCAHELFEAQVRQRPQALGLQFEEQCLTYAELNRRANQLARKLRRLGVRPEVLVGISIERGPEMIVGILGVLKAGGAYLPLDPNYPAERLAFMLEDAGAPVLLTQAHLLERLPLAGWGQGGIRRLGQAGGEPAGAGERWVVCLDADWELIGEEAGEDLAGISEADDLAYVIYTSGSTGKPKGTLLSHRGLVNLAGWQQQTFHIGEGSRVLQFSPFSFDASVWETFMALANGGTLVLGRQEVLASGVELVNLMRDSGVTNVTLPPSVLRVLPEEEQAKLETVIAAGEACPAELVERWAAGREFYNAYGPTETTVCASAYRCSQGEGGAPPIGKPIANTRLYVLDRHGEPVPVGVAGELHVGGVSLARGYLDRAELTAEKFVPDPFGEPGKRLYKTGDLVKWRRDGNLEYLGRVDQQVKVRGFRIELGEIEAALETHPGVREAVVLAWGAGERRLVAYVVAKLGGGPGDVGEQPAVAELKAQLAAQLRTHLRSSLPEYMLPAAFQFLEGLPMTPNGKVDRKRLPAPEWGRTEREYVAPRTEVEAKLAGLCAELLEVERVGVEDNFFEIGGHSLLATQLISRVRGSFGVELPLRSLFEHPTIATLAEAVQQAVDQVESQSGELAAQPPAIIPVARDRHRMRRSDLNAADGNFSNDSTQAKVMESGGQKRDV